VGHFETERQATKRLDNRLKTCYNGLVWLGMVLKTNGGREMKKLSAILKASGMSDEDVVKELTGEIATYQEQDLPKPITYAFDPDQYENLTEAQAGEDWPGDGEILKLVNRQKLTAAKQKSYATATKKLKEDYEKTPTYRRKALVAALLAANFSKDEAEALAEQRIKA
jgi:hypothetical protein